MKKKHDQQQKHVNHWLKSQKKYAHGKLSRAIAFGAVNGLLMVVQTAMFAYLINLVIFPQDKLAITDDLNTPKLLDNDTFTQELFSNSYFSDITLAIIVISFIIICRALLGYLSECYSRRGGAMDIKANIRSRILNRLLQLGPSYTQAKGGGLNRGNYYIRGD